MSREELIEKDSTFSESQFLREADNTFIIVLSSIMIDNIERVKYMIGEELYQKYSELLDKLNSENQRQMYDEMNIKLTHIEEISEDEENLIIKVLLISRYKEYIANKLTLKYISGNKDTKITKYNRLTFTKKKAFNSSDKKICKSCGKENPIAAQTCESCQKEFETNIGWLLTNLEWTNHSFFIKKREENLLYKVTILAVNLSPKTSTKIVELNLTSPLIIDLAINVSIFLLTNLLIGRAP